MSSLNFVNKSYYRNPCSACEVMSIIVHERKNKITTAFNHYYQYTITLIKSLHRNSDLLEILYMYIRPHMNNEL